MELFIFWLIIYILTGCVTNAMIIVWEARDAAEEGKIYNIECWTLKELYNTFLWPLALIQYIINSMKKLNETPKNS